MRCGRAARGGGARGGQPALASSLGLSVSAKSAPLVGTLRPASARARTREPAAWPVPPASPPQQLADMDVARTMEAWGELFEKSP